MTPPFTYETIRVEAENDVVTIVLNRPAEGNAVTAQMRADLRHAIERAPKWGRVLALTGEGDVFCAGDDLTNERTVRAVDLERNLRDETGPLILELADCPLPTIAAVNGLAAGAGASLALAVDIAIAKESAAIQLPGARIGMMSDAAAMWFAAQRVGLARAMGLALFAEPVPARQAADWGLIWQATTEAEFMETVARRAVALANGPTAAYRATKTALRDAAARDLAQQLDTEASLQGELGRSRDFLEGLLAFSDRRPPSFTGH